MSNSANMTLEEKLVQNIKVHALAEMIDDDDAITELTKRAVHEALFKSTPGRGYNAPDQDSLVVAAAKQLAQQTLDKVFEEEYKKLLDNPEIRLAIADAIMALLPSVVAGMANQMNQILHSNADAFAKNRIMQAFTQQGFRPPQF